jgi:CheY-like chemotaxis protein
MIKRILVVDDDPDIVEYLCTFLGDHGYEVLAADASASALAVLEGTQVDAVVVDVLMPGRSGLDLLVTLRRDPRWRDLRVVVLTGSDHVLEDAGRSYIGLRPGMRGADQVLGKPVDPGELLGALEQTHR